MEADNRRIRAEFSEKKIPALKKLEAMYLSTMDVLAKNPVLANVMFSDEQYRESKMLSAKVIDIQNITLETICRILDEGIQKNQIRKDIPEKEICLIIMGTMRLIAVRWRLSGFHPDLMTAVKNSWKSLKVLLTPARRDPPPLIIMLVLPNILLYITPSAVFAATSIQH